MSVIETMLIIKEEDLMNLMDMKSIFPTKLTK